MSDFQRFVPFDWFSHQMRQENARQFVIATEVEVNKAVDAMELDMMNIDPR